MIVIGNYMINQFCRCLSLYAENYCVVHLPKNAGTLQRGHIPEKFTWKVSGKPEN